MRRNLAPWGWVSVLVVMMGMMSFPSPAQAVVLAVGDGTGNTSAPPDDPGFSNVGSRGVYLGDFSGNHWVLTAFHVGAGTITLDGAVYNEVPGSATRVANPSGSGLSQNTDLFLFLGSIPTQIYPIFRLV